MKNTSKNALSLSHLSMQESPETNTHTLSEIFGAPIGREESIAQIAASPETKAAFQSLSFGAKEEMIAFFQNQKIPPITSDPFFKKLFNPTEHPDRLRDFLSCILQKEISSLTPLPLEGIKLAEESSFVVLDLVVQTADGETIDVEMQKIGYDFPGQRSDCYAADFIMRQYAKEKAERGKQFNYRDLCPVYVIVLMEQSSSVFRKAAPFYIHRSVCSYDSKIELSHLSRKIFISLDTFHDVVHNIDNKLDAWLTFLAARKPEDIVPLIQAYPEYIKLYQEIADFKKNPKEVIYMYSEALAILDRNTALYMIEERQKEIKELDARLAEKTAELYEKTAELSEKNAELSEKNAELSEKDRLLAENATLIADLRRQLKQQQEIS